jgi:hypothetical protein|tara:strand:- start:845 stop:1267 length:423 start_codon:yes stop_codon:yes gene_type:complete
MNKIRRTLTERKYLPTLSELIDRLSIVQLKEVFITEHKEEYAKEIKEISHDIELILNDKNVRLTGDDVRAIVVLSQMNLHIWHNETKYRAGTGDGNLGLTHGLNGIRNIAKNKIQENEGGRKDYKVDCIAAEFKDWEISW